MNTYIRGISKGGIWALWIIAVRFVDYSILTPFPLLPHICVSESSQHWFRLWLVAFSAPSHYLNKCWDIVNYTIRNKRQWNFNHNTKLFIHGHASEIIVSDPQIFLPHHAIRATFCPYNVEGIGHSPYIMSTREVYVICVIATSGNKNMAIAAWSEISLQNCKLTHLPYAYMRHELGQHCFRRQAGVKPSSEPVLIYCRLGI